MQFLEKPNGLLVSDHDGHPPIGSGSRVADNYLGFQHKTLKPKP